MRTPEGESQKDLMRRQELVYRTQLAIIVVFGIYLLASVFLQRYSGLVLGLPFLALISLTPLISKFTKSPWISGQWVVFNLYWILALGIYRRSAEVTMVNAWMLFIPVLATMFGRRRSGLIWISVVFVTFLFFEFLKGIDHSFYFTLDKVVSDELSFLGVLLLIALSLFLTFVYERYNDENISYIKTIMLEDELTGLHNRRGFLILADRQLKSSKRTQNFFAIVFIDLDKFKKINDLYGHNEGDMALSAVAKILRASTRETDCVARFGGDEFVVALNLQRKEDVEVVISKIKDNLQKHNEESQKPYTISLSFGYALSSPDQSNGFDFLLNKADKQMYQNKQEKK